MTKSLDLIHPIAMQIQDIEQSVAWHISNFSCEVAHEKTLKYIPLETLKKYQVQ